MSANLEGSPRANKSLETAKAKKTKTKEKSSDTKSSTKKRKRDEPEANHENENDAADTSPKPSTTTAAASTTSPIAADRETDTNSKDASTSVTQADAEAPRKKRKYTKRQPRSATTVAEDADADVDADAGTAATAKGTGTTSPNAGIATGEGATTGTEKDAPRQKRKYTRRAPILVSSAPADLSGADTSPFLQQTTSFYLPLAPITSHMPLEGLCAEHLSPMLLSYVQPFKGVVMGYSNARFSGSPAGPSEDSKRQDSQEEEGERLGRVLAKSIDEYSAPHTWLTADFTLLKPDRSAWIEGHVSLQSKSHIGLVCWNLFNASIERRRMPSGWRWRGHDTDALEDLGPATSSKKGKKKKNQEGEGEEEDDDDDSESSDEEEEEVESEAQGANRHGKRNRHDLDGYWVDADGNKIGGTLKFRIRDLETTPSYGRENGFVSIEGSLLDEKTDLRNDKNEIARRRREQARENKEKAALM